MVILVNKRHSDFQKGNMVEWNSSLITGLGLKESQVSMIEDIISCLSSSCKSIILCGSWAEGTSRKNSDLDLLFITDDYDGKKTTIAQLERMLDKTPFYDCKVLTVDELRRLSNELQHFGIWLMVIKGIVLNGTKVQEIVKLDHERVRSILDELLDRINHSISELAANNQYRGACVQIAYTARTLFFVEKHILKNWQDDECKKEYLERILGTQLKAIERIYYEDVVSKKSFGKLESVQRIQLGKEVQYSSNQYEELLSTCLKIERFLISSKQQLESLFDLP